MMLPKVLAQTVPLQGAAIDIFGTSMRRAVGGLWQPSRERASPAVLKWPVCVREAV